MPITSLPLEVLSMDFEHYAKDDLPLGNSPCPLMLVCRQWYLVALSTPSLWNTILVAKHASDYWSMERNSNLRGKSRARADTPSADSLMQICNTAARLNTILVRTKNVHLDVTLALAPSLHDPEGLYSILFSAKVTSRIAHLTLDYFGSWDEVDKLSTLVESNPLRNFVSLCIFAYGLSVPLPIDKSTLQLILEGSKKLRGLYIDLYFPLGMALSYWNNLVLAPVFPTCITWPMWKDDSYSSTIRNLNRLEVPLGEAVNIMYGEDVPVREFVIQAVTQIETVESSEMWKIDIPPWPTASSPVTTFSRVKYLHLVLDDLSLLTKLVLPALEEFRLTQSSESRRKTIGGDTESLAAPNVPIHLPKLHTLKVIHASFSPLRWISAEQLKSVHLTSTLLSRKEAEMGFTDLFSSINSEKSPDISESVLIQALELLPRLEFLSITLGDQLERVFIEEMTVDVEHDTVKTKILCPVLQVLELDLHAYLEWDEMGDKATRVGTVTFEDFSSALKRMVSSREQGHTSRLERCTVIEKDGVRREYV